jgi:hypothetical protein
MDFGADAEVRAMGDEYLDGLEASLLSQVLIRQDVRPG